jgi:hypothetical protein
MACVPAGTLERVVKHEDERAELMFNAGRMKHLAAVRHLWSRYAVEGLVGARQLPHYSLLFHVFRRQGTSWYRRMSSASVVEAAAGTKPGEDAAPSEPASISGAEERAAHEEQLLKLLLHPIPRTAKYSGQLAQNLSVVHGQWFIDPEAALRSTIRALYVIKHMLREDAHILVVNSSSVMAPLMQVSATNDHDAVTMRQRRSHVTMGWHGRSWRG